VAQNHPALVAAVNDRAWQEKYLLSGLVHQLHEAGKLPGPGQCDVLAPHPAAGGRNPCLGDTIDPRFVMVVDMLVCQSLCAQSLFETRA
jgi:hypothetical protein